MYLFELIPTVTKKNKSELRKCKKGTLFIKEEENAKKAIYLLKKKKLPANI